MAPRVHREIRLKRRPVGIPTEADFEIAETPVPEPSEGEVLVRNIYMSVDPYMRGRMIERKSYMPPFELGKPLEGGCVGQVVESRQGKLSVGQYVLGMQGWREYYVSDGSGLMPVQPAGAPVRAYLGVLGMPGLTAYVGLLDIGKPEAGNTIFVAAAAGAVGSVVCQIGKIRGCRVVGSAGSDEKVRWLLEEARVDAAFNYKAVGSLTQELERRCPDGVDVYFENVGGEHLEAALDNMKQHGRIVLCGMISRYNSAQPAPGPWNLFQAVAKRLTLRGFLVGDHLGRVGSFASDMGRWIAEGKVRWRETIVDGIENAPAAFIGLFKGENIGKMLVRIGPEPGGCP
ncbi:MAG: NADP-dependent oxidoreductase [bacterium]